MAAIAKKEQFPLSHVANIVKGIAEQISENMPHVTPDEIPVSGILLWIELAEKNGFDTVKVNKKSEVAK